MGVNSAICTGSNRQLRVATTEPLRFPPLYYNTTKLKGEELKAKREKITWQDEQVLDYFKAASRERCIDLMTPWDVEYGLRPMMITSVRRSINTLTKLGYLEKTKERRRSGPANEMNYCWKLSR